MLDFKIADLAKDEKLVSYTRNLAIQILDDDPDLQKPEHYRLKAKVDELIRSEVNWSVIS